MYPTLEKLKNIAQSGEYRRIPVCHELYSDRYTPVEVMRTLRTASRHCYLLESASQTEVWGRYSFLGYEPSMEITCTDGNLQIRKIHEDGTEEKTVQQVKHPGDAIRQILKEYKSPVLENMPTFTGGLVGYFSYDYIKYSEPKLKLTDETVQDFRDMDLMLFDQVIAFDHYRQKVLLITGVMTGDLENSYRKAEEKLKEMADLIRNGKQDEFPSLKLKSSIEPQFPKEKYCEMVETARHYIREGDIFQVVLSNPMRAKAEGSLFDTYRVLRATNPSPYMFYFSSDDIEIAGASPETLAKLTGTELSTFPLAGTRPRGKTKEEDQALEKGLLSDEKERAEHNMLVDLGRNDIGKISKIGTVNVEKYMCIERFSHVMHIGSTVTGQIRDDKDAVDAVDAILPAGTLSGAPKFRACQIIQELEQSKRGIYGGAIGYLDFAGNLDTCIAIRDNYDSFSYNVYQLIGSVEPDIKVVRNDEVTIEELEAMKPEALILSPGPGRPEDAGICIESIKYFKDKLPILGICLGHQSICEAFGGTVSYAKELMHGKQKEIHKVGESQMFEGLPETFLAARYHSLAAIRDTLPEELVVTAESEDGEVMALEHKKYPIFGLQFHPESVMTPDGKTMIENFIKVVREK